MLELAGGGKKNAITGKQMALQLRLPDDRKVRKLIEELIEEGMPIASSVGDPGGFFMVQTEAEAYDYIKVLANRRDEIDNRLVAFQNAIAKTGMIVPEQGLMELGYSRL
jgi:hypothetical protein